MKNNRKISPRILAAGFTAGIALALAAYLYLYPTHFSEDAHLARSIGVSPRSYIESKRLWKEGVENKQPLSDSDFQSALSLLRYHIHQKGWAVRARAVEALRASSGTHNEAAAQTAVQGALSDPSYVVRRQALISLWRLDPVAGHTAALKDENDSSDAVRRTAYLLLNPNVPAK